MNYDSLLFVEIIESVQGIQFLRSDNQGDVKVRFYQGLNGKLVMIDISEEYIDDNSGKGYLNQLGLDYLVSAMFPQQLKNAIQEVNEIISQPEDKQIP